MGRPIKHDQTFNKIMEWFEAGNVGSALQISQALGIGRETVDLAIRRLNRTGMISALDKTILPSSRGKVCVIWGESEVTFNPKPVNVAAVICSQPDLVQVWNRMFA
jgi:hypothetical protein